MSTRAQEGGTPRRASLHPGDAGILTASWALAGGLAASLCLVALILTDRLHPGGLIPIAVFVAVVGSVFGTVHGAVLGYLGRPTSEVVGGNRGELVIACLVVTAAFGITLTGGVWMTLNATLARAGSPLGWALLGASVVASLGIATWATVLGWRALARAYHRWPDHRLGSWLVGGAFAVLTVGFLGLRPAIPGTGLHVSPLGAVLLAATATLWIGLPAIIVTLPFAHRRPPGSAAAPGD